MGDLNGDGKPDIIVSEPQVKSVGVLLNNGNGTFAPGHIYSVGGTPTAVAVGDFNRDGKLDIVTANSNGTVSLLLNKGAGAANPKLLPPAVGEHAEQIAQLFDVFQGTASGRRPWAASSNVVAMMRVGKSVLRLTPLAHRPPERSHPAPFARSAASA